MPKNYDIAAYFWPAYHDEPRWREFMPEGIGEWETIQKAAPKEPGHKLPRVPLWGYESESDPRVMEKKLAAAADHGVNVFIFDWYWYDNQPFLEDALNKGYLQAKNNDRVKFYLMWANHDAGSGWKLWESHTPRVIWPGAVDRATFDTVADRVIRQYFSHPSYYTIDGKPVFCIYELETLMNGLGGVENTRAALDSLRAKTVAAGFPGLHIQGVLWGMIPPTVSMIPGAGSDATQDNTVRALGLDSLTNYQWCHYCRPHGPYGAWAEKAIASWEPWAKQFSVPFFPHVSVGWDTNPRFPRKLCDYVSEQTPAQFGTYLRRAMDFVDRHGLSPRLISVNAWNEWSESSYLEPDTEFGMGYLEAIRDAMRG